MLTAARQPDRGIARHAVALLCAAVVAFSTGSALAEEPSKDQMANAQALFDEGIRLFNLGRFREACPKFEASLDLVAGVGTRGKLAECYENLGKTASAWRLYKEVERLAEQSGDGLRVRVAAERVRALEPRLARLTVEPGPSVVASGFTIAVNGLPLAPREYGMSRIVDPGNHTVIAQAPGYRPWVRSMRVAEGSEGTLSVPMLAPLESAPTPPPAYDSRDSRERTASYALIGVGAVVMLGGGAYFGTRARSQWDRAFEDGHCNRATLECDAVGLERSRSAKSNANLANIAVGVGAASTIAGIVLYVRSRPARTPSATSSMRVEPALQPEGVFLAVTARF